MNTSASTCEPSHDSFLCSRPHCLPFCSAQRSPCCSACCEDCCTAAPSRGSSSSARLPRTISSSSATCDAAARSLPPTTCAPADHLQHQRLAHLVIHNILHYVRHLPGGLESPAAAPPLRGARRRLHASGTRNPHENSQPLWPADHRPRLCANKPTPLPCVTCSRIHKLLLLCV